MTGSPEPRTLTADVEGEPWQLLQDWLPANTDPRRPPMTLSSVTPDGRADARTVLLSEFQPAGFFFHTDAGSRKSAELAANPAVALTFLWPGLPRQLVAQGYAEPAPAAELAAAYRARSRYLQQLAWQNTPGFAQLPAAQRRERWAAFGADHESGFEPPPGWTGYLVRPARLSFWLADPETASRRTEFVATATGWQLSLLPG